MCKAGNINEAYTLAEQDYNAEPQNAWTQREVGWVLYYMLKNDVENKDRESFYVHLHELSELNLLTIQDDSLIFNNVVWKLVELIKLIPPENTGELERIFQFLLNYHFAPFNGYSVLLKQIIKFDSWIRMVEFFEWWNIDNLMPEDYQPFKMDNGKKIMSLAEQAYIAYSKALLKLNDREKIKNFIPKIEKLMEEYPDMMYPGYFCGKLKLSLGVEREDTLDIIMPFVRKKKTEFWVWQLLAEFYRDEIDILLDESDTCPHSLFSKTAHTMNFHIIFGLLHGCSGGKLWISNTRFYAPEPVKKYPEIIGKYQGFYRELNRTLKGVKWHGAQRSVPAPENDLRPDFPGKYYHIMDWESKATGYFGLPHRCAKATVKGIHMFVGEQIRHFSDAELERFLSDGCILDASAAKELGKRGFSKLVGVVPEPLTAKTSAGEWMKGMNYPVRQFGSNKYKLVPADKNAVPEYISEFRDIEYNQAAKTVKVSDGAALFTNSKGAKVITVPFDICDSRISIVPERQDYMRKIFDIMGVLPAWSTAPFDVYFRFGTLANGKQDISAVCNISYEPMDEVNIGVKKVPSKIEKLSPDGGWDICKFTVKKDIITISDQLRCSEIGIYKFSY